ncbi:MAG: hypothetical protein WC522_07360 [Candidatus Omnitrophota bacterium]
MACALKFKFKKGITKKLIESQIAIAVVTAECMFGQAKVRLNAGYVVSKNRAVIDVSNKVGEYIAQVFTGLITRQIGEDKFTVDRVKTKG